MRSAKGEWRRYHSLLLNFCEWLAGTPGSVALHESQYVYSLVESVHVLTLTLFVGLAAMLDLRLLGLAMRKTRVSEIVSRFLPWLSLGFVVMVVSGALLFYAIPVRSFQSVFFRVKLLMLAMAGVNVWVFHATIYQKVGGWDLARRPPRAARVAGAVSLVLWATIIVCGRMIAYNWFDCDKPQPAIVNWVAGCGLAPR